MKWKTAFKIALQHPFLMLQNFFNQADPPLISEAGEKELQRQALIKMMNHDQEAGLYDIDKQQTTMAKFRKRQTALQWYIEQCENIKYNPLEKNGYTIAKEKITKQALEMEREQKIEFAKQCLDKALDLDIRTAHSKVEEYHNEIYGGNNDN